MTASVIRPTIGGKASPATAAARMVSTAPAARPRCARSIDPTARPVAAPDAIGSSTRPVSTSTAVHDSTAARYASSVAASSACVPVATGAPSRTHHHPVAGGQQGRAGGHQHRRAAGPGGPQPGGDAVLGGGVDGGGRVVQHQDLRVGGHGPGQRDPLALPAGEPPPALAHRGRRAVGQRGDHLVGGADRGHGGQLGGVDARGVAGASDAMLSATVPSKSTASWSPTSTAARSSSSRSSGSGTPP